MGRSFTGGSIDEQYDPIVWHCNKENLTLSSLDGFLRDRGFLWMGCGFMFPHVNRLVEEIVP